MAAERVIHCPCGCYWFGCETCVFRIRQIPRTPRVKALVRVAPTALEMVREEREVRRWSWAIRPWWQRAVLRLFGFGP